MKRKSVNDIVGGNLWRDVVQFNHDGEEFHRNTKVKDYLNRILGCNFNAVYTREKKYDTTYGLSYDGEIFYVVTSMGTVVYFTNSEWAAIDVEK